MSVRRLRFNRARQISFDALESRRVMSAGVSHMFHTPLAADGLHPEAKAVAPVMGSFKGSIQEVESGTVDFSGLSGKLGKIKLKGSGVGELSGSQFEGATLQFTGANGTLTVQLYGSPIKHAAKGAGTFTSEMIIQDATGNYAGDNGAVEGSAGNFSGYMSDPVTFYGDAAVKLKAMLKVGSASKYARLLLESPLGSISLPG
jgi:hypothetical protein